MDRETINKKLSGGITKFPLKKYDLEVSVRPLSPLAIGRLADKGINLNSESVFENVETLCLIVAYGLVDDEGNRIYSPDVIEDVSEDIQPIPLKKIANKIIEISKSSEDEETDLKNLKTAPKEDSSSDSQKPSSDGM